MAFMNYLIKLGNGTILPMRYMAVESYKITPNQRMESKATRSVTGILHRTTVEHTASKIEFNTPVITNRDLNELTNMLHSAFTNTLERKLNINYYDPETDSYKDAEVYMPDSDYPIMRVDTDTNTVYFNSVRFAFIEY